MTRSLGWFLFVSAVAGAGLLARHDAPTTATHPAPSAALRAPAEARAEAAFTGLVVPAESVDLAAHADGRIESIAVRLGDRVLRGQPLAVMDTRSLRDDLAMAEASLAAARAAVDRAELEQKVAHSRFERRRALTGTSLSDEEVAQAESEADLAGPRLAAARAAVKERESHAHQLFQALEDAVLVAPFDGSVAARYLDPPAQVTRGAPVLRVVRTGDARLRFAVDEAHWPRVAEGTAVDAQIEGGPRLAGTVEKVAPEVDPSSRLVFVEARLDDAAPGDHVLGRVAHVTLLPPDGATARSTK
jgi:RND family efflux transporter MFP subunit